MKNNRPTTQTIIKANQAPGVIAGALARMACAVFLIGALWGLSAARPALGAVSAPDARYWERIDRDTGDAMNAAFHEAEAYASRKLNIVFDEMKTRIDADFLEWYFSYLQQQWMGLKGIGYWLEDTRCVEYFFGESPGMAEKITLGIQQEYSNRVLRPATTQIQLEQIANETARVFLNELGRRVEHIQAKYEVPESEWNAYLSDLVILESRVNGSREVALTMKAIVAAGSLGTIKSMVMLKRLISKIVVKVMGRSGGVNASGAVGKIATKTAGKAAGKAAGKFAGVIVGAAIIAWDVWDHHHMEKTQRPIFSRKLKDHLDEVKYHLLNDSNTGIMAMISMMQDNVLASLGEKRKTRKRT